MQALVICRVLGLLLMMFSITMLPPIIVGQVAFDPEVRNFLWAGLIQALVGFVIWWPVRRSDSAFRMRDGYLIAVLFWFGLSAAATLPLLLSHSIEISVADAFFETVSGFTTTGATVLSGLDSLPRSINFYRLELHWLGGMGILVLAIAVMPKLGSGGMKLFMAESPGPDKNSKLTPRIAETAKILWFLYFGLTVVCAITYWWLGMSPFDAICHAFSTVSTGGFSTHDQNFAFFQSAALDYAAVFFMALSATNFALMFLAWRRRSILTYWRDSEFLAYGLILLVLVLIICFELYQYDYFPSLELTFRTALFHAVSIMTSTGLTIDDHSDWPSFLPVLLVFSSFVGGCAGSTGGGIKVVRVLLLFKQAMREIRLNLHPNARIKVKLSGNPVDERVVNAVWGYFALYVAVFALFLLIVQSQNHSQVTAFSAVAATLNNMGVGLGEVASSFNVLDDTSKWWLCLAMLMGRLELFTVLVLLSPSFWRE